MIGGRELRFGTLDAADPRNIHTQLWRADANHMRERQPRSM